MNFRRFLSVIACFSRTTGWGKFRINSRGAAPLTCCATRPSQSFLFKDSCSITTKGCFDRCFIISTFRESHVNPILKGASCRRRFLSQQITGSPAQYALTFSIAKNCFTVQNASLNRSTQRTRFRHHTRNLRTSHIVLVLRNRHRSQNTDDRHNDHQLNQRKTLLGFLHHFHRLHVTSPEIVGGKCREFS